MSTRTFPSFHGLPPEIASALYPVWDRLNLLQGRDVATIPLFAPLDLQAHRVTGVADPTTGQDAVTLSYADAHYGARAIRLALQAGGSAPINIAGLPGAETLIGVVRYGTHAERLLIAADSLAAGTLFWETDRAALYQVQAVSSLLVWVLALCRPLRTSTTKPSDLGTNDTGFTWFQSDAGYEWRWSGTNWNYYRGSLVDTFSNIPDPALADRGFLFVASDYGQQVWRKGSTKWEILEGVGGPMRGTISPNQKPAAGTLETANVTSIGFRFTSTDFDREYRFDGTVYADSPGQPTRGSIQFFPITLHADFTPGAGWALCDGTAGVTRSTPSGGTTTVTVPDLTTANRFFRSVSGATGGTGGSATTHTHPIDPPSTTSASPSANTTTGPSATVAVQAGAGTTVATDTHTHDHDHTHAVDVASFTSGTPSGTGGDDALPPYYNVRPYIRL